MGATGPCSTNNNNNNNNNNKNNNNNRCTDLEREVVWWRWGEKLEEA